MRFRNTLVLSAALFGALAVRSLPAIDQVGQPFSYVYRGVGGMKLNAYVFMPSGQASQGQTSAILLFHGGGWVAGSASWTFDDARRFAALGMVAIAIDYRLAAGEITPLEALDDTRVAFQWVRRQAAEFNIDPNADGFHRRSSFRTEHAGTILPAAGDRQQAFATAMKSLTGAAA